MTDGEFEHDPFLDRLSPLERLYLDGSRLFEQDRQTLLEEHKATYGFVSSGDTGTLFYDDETPIVPHGLADADGLRLWSMAREDYNDGLSITVLLHKGSTPVMLDGHEQWLVENVLDDFSFAADRMYSVLTFAEHPPLMIPWALEKFLEDDIVREWRKNGMPINNPPTAGDILERLKSTMFEPYLLDDIDSANLILAIKDSAPSLMETWGKEYVYLDDGAVITDPQEVADYWAEHFRKKRFLD